MKTSRGSNRISTQNPKGTKEKIKKKKKSHNIRSEKSNVSGSEDSEHVDKIRLNRNEKNQKSWKPLSRSSLLAIENMMNLSVLSVLTLKSKEKEESQKHLNILKNQFLARCAQLSVPPRKYGDIIKVSYQFKTESRKSEHGRKTLEALEENLLSLVGTLEEMEVKMERLEEKCSIMRRRVDDEEEKSQEILQLSEQTVLSLPALPPRPANEPSLQERMMKMIHNPCDVVRALQTDPVVDGVKEFLMFAYEQVDSVQTNPDTDS